MARIPSLCLFFFFVVMLLSCAQTVTKHSGVVVYGHEARTVRLCSDQRLLWLHASPKQHEQLILEFDKLTNRPYQELYLDFTGSLMDESPGELAKDYDGTIRLDEIHGLSTAIPEYCRAADQPLTPSL